MPYADLVYYKNTFKGAASTDEEIGSFLEKASELLDEISNFQTQLFDDLTPTFQEYIRKAVCAQVEHWVKYGEENTSTSTTESFTLGSLSINKAQSESKAGQKDISPRTIRLMNLIGFLYKGVEIV